ALGLERAGDRGLARLEVQRALLRGVVGDGQDHVVAEGDRPAGEVEMPQGVRVERAGQYDGAHGRHSSAPTISGGQLGRVTSSVTSWTPSSSIVPIVRVPVTPVSSPVPEPGAMT